MLSCRPVHVGQCCAFFYEDLFADDPAMLERAEALRDRMYEFTEFLTDVLGIDSVPLEQPTAERTVAYHPSCHLLREMRVTDGPRDAVGQYRRRGPG